MCNFLLENNVNVNAVTFSGKEGAESGQRIDIVACNLAHKLDIFYHNY